MTMDGFARNLLDKDDSLLLHFDISEAEKRYKELSKKPLVKNQHNSTYESVISVNTGLSLIAERQYSEVDTFQSQNSVHSKLSLRIPTQTQDERNRNVSLANRSSKTAGAVNSQALVNLENTLNITSKLTGTDFTQMHTSSETFKKPFIPAARTSKRHSSAFECGGSVEKPREKKPYTLGKKQPQIPKENSQVHNDTLNNGRSMMQNQIIDTSASINDTDLFRFDEYDFENKLPEKIENTASKPAHKTSSSQPNRLNVSDLHQQRGPPDTASFSQSNLDISLRTQWTQDYEMNLLDQHNDTLSRELNSLYFTMKTKRHFEDDFDEAQISILESSFQMGDESKLHEVDDINWSVDTFTINTESQVKTGFDLMQTLALNASKEKRTTVLPTTPTVSSDFLKLGPFYDLPLKVKELIRNSKGIHHLYDWQDECLNLKAIKDRTNLIYALPTSGGKTLVAEILLLREILCRRKDVLFILPFVAIVQEKVWALSPFQIALNFLVEEYASNKGQFPPRIHRTKQCAYIATMEKASSLINSLIEKNRLSEIGLIIVDEIHLIGDQSRGVTLETSLTKIIHSKENIHIVGMSATIGNLHELCSFLNAEMYTRDFRPIELIEYIKCENQIAKINSTGKDGEEFFIPCRQISCVSETINMKDPDNIGMLVSEVVTTGSCLIFCPTKKNCENVAILLTQVLDSSVLQRFKFERAGMIASLDVEQKMCPVLKQILPYGIAYHHSGLTSEERGIIEDGFRGGVLNVICCTSTLAAGVNLPAQRVILRAPYVGRNFITLSKYKQMVGRAGRAGLGETGDSIVICTKTDIPKIRKILSAPMDQALSTLHEFDGNGLSQFILSAIGLEIADTRTALGELVKCSLLSIQSKKLQVDVDGLIDKVIVDLIKNGTVYPKINVNGLNSEARNNSITVVIEAVPDQNDGEDDSKLSTSPKIYISRSCELAVTAQGKATINGGFSMSRAQMLYQDLVQAQASLVLLNSLHLLFLVTPYDVVDLIKPDYEIYYRVYTSFTADEMQTAKILGLSEYCVSRMMRGQPMQGASAKSIHRFYVTIMLYDLWKEVPVFTVAEKFKVNRGIIQQLMTSSAAFASSVFRFCECLEQFQPFCALLQDISNRLAHCCIPELVPLMDLPGVQKARAKQLCSAGYKDLHSIAAADPATLVRCVKHLNKRTAQQIISGAKMLLLNKVEMLREDAQDILLKMEV